MSENTEQFQEMMNERLRRKERVMEAAHSRAPEHPAGEQKQKRSAMDLNPSSSTLSGRIATEPEESVFTGPHNVSGRLPDGQRVRE
jgi:hypothetical protein